MSNPMVQQMMSDPQFMNQIIQSNPMLQQMVSANPQLREMLSNPAMMQQMMNPQTISAAMQMMQNQGGPGMGAMGGMPGSMSMPGGAGGAGGMNPGMGGMGGMGGMPMMNPALMQQYMAMQGMGGGGFQGVNARPPRERFATELNQLKEMGFTDEETNLQMLQQCNGNVNLAIERLFAFMGNQ